MAETTVQDHLRSLETALLPHRPVRSWSTSDIEAAVDALSALETTLRQNDAPGALRPETLKSVSYICQYSRHIPSGTSKMHEQSRVVEDLLREIEAKNAWTAVFEKSDAATIVTQIQDGLTSPGMRHSKFVLSDLSPILLALSQSDITSPFLKDSALPQTIRSILDAPCIPLISGSKLPLRTQALHCLQRWFQQLPSSTTPDDIARLGLSNLDAYPEHSSASTSAECLTGTELVYKLEEISGNLADLRQCVDKQDLQGVMGVLDLMKSWKVPDYRTERFGPPEASLAKNLTSTLSKLKSALQRTQSQPSHPLSPAQIQAPISALQSIIDHLSTLSHRKYTPSITGCSYLPSSSSPPTSDSSLQIIFRDAGYGKHGCFGYGGYSTRAGPLIWDDIPVSAPHLSSPVQILFESFFEEARNRYRHPMAPLTDFLISHRNFIHEPKPHDLWQTKEYAFAQGTIADLCPATGNILYHFRHDGKFSTNHTSIHTFTSKFPTIRTLPPSCQSSPEHWFTPISSPALEANYHCLPALAFCGNGSDIYPRISTESILVAKYLWIPKSLAFLGLDDYSWHGPVKVDKVPEKLYCPMTKDGAMSLVGRTVCFEDPSVDTGKDMMIQSYGGLGSAGRGAPKKKKRKIAASKEGQEVPDWDHVFLGFVWALDEDKMELKLWVFPQNPEVCRTFQVGVPFEGVTEREMSLEGVSGFLIDGFPMDYPSLRRPVVPKWIGVVVGPGDEVAQTIFSQPAPSSSRPTSQPSSSNEPRKAQTQPGEDRLSKILALAPRECQVGLDGDCTICAGEIALHGIDSDQLAVIDGCRPGVWESGRAEEDEPFEIWMQWVREGCIDWKTYPRLNEPGDTRIPQISPNLVWTNDTTSVTVDGGSITLLSRSVIDPDSIADLVGPEEEMPTGDFVECIVLIGQEDARYWIPGGITSYTGADGGYAVDLARDENQGDVVGVRIRAR